MSSVNLVLKTSDLIATPVIKSNFIKTNINSFIQNNSFETPTVIFKYYGDLNDGEKIQFVWSAGGNLANPKGPAITTPGNGFNFPSNLTGNQVLAMQSISFIEQTIYLNIGTYVFSMYYMTRNSSDFNPINILINGVLLTTLNKVVTTWTLFNYTFNILEAGNKIIRLEGTLSTDKTTGIDLVAIALKTFTYIPIPNDKMISNTTTQQGALGYEISASSTYSNVYSPFKSSNGQLTEFWNCGGIQSSTPPYSRDPYSNGTYIGGGTVNSFITTTVSNKDINGEWLQIKLNKPIILKSFGLSGRDGYNSFNPKKFIIGGSNDGSLWNLLDSYDLQNNYANTSLENYIVSNNLTTYLYYRLIIISSFSGISLSISQFNLYGYEDGKTNTNLQNYIENYPPYAIFRAQDYNNATIPEARGKTFTATTIGNITTGNESGNGSTASIPFLSGTTTTQINFNVNVPTNFTVCSITRYNGNARGRILTTQTGTWLHGHWSLNGINRGVAYYEKWMTNKVDGPFNNNNGKGLITDWLVMCGKNGSNQPTNILADNNKVGFVDGGLGGQSNIGINNKEEFSDFAFNQILIWDRLLTDDDMQKVSNYLTEYLTTSSNIQPLQQMATVITNSYKLLWPVNLESLLCHMYDEYDKFQICLQYVAGNVSTTRPQNLNILLSGLPFTLEYKFNSNNRSTITLANIKIDTDTFYQQYSLLQYHTFTSQAIANILINITNMDNDVINETFFNSLIFSFNIIGDPNCKKKISRLL